MDLRRNQSCPDNEREVMSLCSCLRTSGKSGAGESSSSSNFLRPGISSACVFVHYLGGDVKWELATCEKSGRGGGWEEGRADV